MYRVVPLSSRSDHDLEIMLESARKWIVEAEVGMENAEDQRLFGRYKDNYNYYSGKAAALEAEIARRKAEKAAAHD